MRARLPAAGGLVLAVLLGACSSNDDEPGIAPENPPVPEQGELVVSPPEQLATYSPVELIARLEDEDLDVVAAALSLTPDCSIEVYHLRYGSVGARDEAIESSGALMLPAGADAECSGARPIVLYAHGTTTDSEFNIGALEDEENTEGVLIAAAFAGQGYIVVAPNYAGYDTSTLDYHPYLNAEQQSADMLDALTAARAALEELGASVSDSGELFIAGYSQGGYVALATHRALQDAGATVTASGPMSGPYALSAFGDAMFLGQVSMSAPVNLTMLLVSYQQAYGDIYSAPEDAFAAPFAMGIETLLPNSTPLDDLQARGLLPSSEVFSSTAPAPDLALLTPATEPAEFAEVFAAGFGTTPLITNEYRLEYVRDAELSPDGGIPALTNGEPPANPTHPLRVALKTNDLRGWTPSAPVLLCGGSGDPTVFFFNTELMSSLGPSVTLLDVDSDPAANEPHADLKAAFATAKELLRVGGGDDAVLQNYHAALVPPFCLRAVKDLFDGL